MDLIAMRRPLVSALLVSGLSLLSGAAHAGFLYGRITPAAGIEPNGESKNVSLSSNGRTVVFSSDASNWGGNPYNGNRAVAVDLMTGVIDIVSSMPDGTVFRGETPAVSGDGRYVAFLTYGIANIGPSWQVVRKDRLTGALEVASANAAGQPADGGTNDDTVSISADGRYIAVETAATNFGLPSGNGREIFVKDMVTGQIEMASAKADGSPSGGRCELRPHALSDDGRYIAMYCNIEMLPGAGTVQIYVRDLQTNTTELISRVGANGPGSTAFPNRYAISPSGRFVSFQAPGYGGLGFADGANINSNSGIYLRDRQTQTTIAIPRPPLVAASNYDSCNVSAISSIGSVIMACPLPNGPSSYSQVFLFVPGAGAPELISTGVGSAPGNQPSGYTMAVNSSGLSMVFESNATDIDPTDGNGKTDIFILAHHSVLIDEIFASGFE